MHNVVEFDAMIYSCVYISSVFGQVLVLPSKGSWINHGLMMMLDKYNNLTNTVSSIHR